MSTLFVLNKTIFHTKEHTSNGNVKGCGVRQECDRGEDRNVKGLMTGMERGAKDKSLKEEGVIYRELRKGI